VSFILRPSLLPFGFAPWFARILRETFTELLTHNRGDGKRFIVRADEILTAFVGIGEGDLCRPTD